ncbi:MAG: hypothetical protein JW896_10460 [Deltaproteobacteria bacterium]|nr:hypothetical protein [Deltaproteobacteria bacterium]
MIPRIWLINVILALCVLFAGGMAYRVWVQEEPLERGAPSSAPSESAPEKTQPIKGTFLRESAYRVIAERSLFSADRKESLPEEPQEKTEKKEPVISGKKIHLYGVIIMEDERKALIDNPVRGPDEPQRKWVSIGDAFSDLRVAAIEPESILLEQGKNEYEISLYDDEEKKTLPSSESGAPSPSTPTVVNTGTQGPSSQGKAASEGDAKQAARPQAFTRKAPSDGNAKPQVGPGAGQRKEDDTTGEFEIVETPFGPIKRKIRSN